MLATVGHLRFRNGREADLSICSPRLLESLLVAGKGTQFAEAANLKVWGCTGELDCGVLKLSLIHVFELTRLLSNSNAAFCVNYKK